MQPDTELGLRRRADGAAPDAERVGHDQPAACPARAPDTDLERRRCPSVDARRLFRVRSGRRRPLRGRHGRELRAMHDRALRVQRGVRPRLQGRLRRSGRRADRVHRVQRDRSSRRASLLGGGHAGGVHRRCRRSLPRPERRQPMSGLTPSSDQRRVLRMRRAGNQRRRLSRQRGMPDGRQRRVHLRLRRRCAGMEDRDGDLRDPGVGGSLTGRNGPKTWSWALPPDTFAGRPGYAILPSRTNAQDATMEPLDHRRGAFQPH
jgi:hypothetical protein